MFVYLCALIGHVVTVETLMALDELILRAISTPLVKLAGFGEQVILASVGLLSYFVCLIECSLDDGHLFPQGVDFDHFLETAFEAIVIFLAKLGVFGHGIEVKLNIFFVESKELFLDDILM